MVSFMISHDHTTLANGYSYKGEYLGRIITLDVSAEASYRNT